MTNFGKLLREFRMRANLSQRALALEANIDTSYISRLESGEREVASRSLALRLANILGLTPQEIDLWLISAGYISPRMQEVANSRISKLMETLDATARETLDDFNHDPDTKETGHEEHINR